jgi:hypothetical protein
MDYLHKTSIARHSRTGRIRLMFLNGRSSYSLFIVVQFLANLSSVFNPFELICAEFPCWDSVEEEFVETGIISC